MIRPAAPTASATAAIAALKAWALAEVVMAAVYFGRWQALRFENPFAPPPPSPLIPWLELAYLLPFFAAVILTWRWWRTAHPARAPGASWAVLVYSLASIVSFGLWDGAVDVAEVRPLFALDAAISLIGLWPALSLVALIRRTPAQP